MLSGVKWAWFEVSSDLRLGDVTSGSDAMLPVVEVGVVWGQ